MERMQRGKKQSDNKQVIQFLVGHDSSLSCTFYCYFGMPFIKQAIMDTKCYHLDMAVCHIHCADNNLRCKGLENWSSNIFWVTSSTGAKQHYYAKVRGTTLAKDRILLSASFTFPCLGVFFFSKSEVRI